MIIFVLFLVVYMMTMYAMHKEKPLKTVVKLFLATMTIGLMGVMYTWGI